MEIQNRFNGQTQPSRLSKCLDEFTEDLTRFCMCITYILRDILSETNWYESCAKSINIKRI